MDLAMLKQLAIGAVPPFVAGVVVVVLLVRGSYAGSAWRRAAIPLLMAVIYVGSHILVFSMPDWPIRKALDTLVFTAVLASVAGSISVVSGAGGLASGLSGAIAAGLGGWFAVRSAAGSWSVGYAAAQFGTLALAAGLNVLASGEIVRGVGGRAGPLAVVIAVAGTAQVLATGFFSLSLGQAAGVGAAAMAGAIAASVWNGADTQSREWSGIVSVPVVVALVSLFQGVHYGGADRPWLLAGSSVVALPAGALVLRLLPSHWKGVRRSACVLLGVVVPLGLAVTIGAIEWLGANRDY